MTSSSATSSSATSSSTARSLRAGHLRLLFAALMVITWLTALDQTIVATALPSIVADIGGQRQIGWVFAAYTLAMTVSMPVFGRLGDLRGRRSLYLGSIAAFVLASVLCGFAGSLTQLIALRFGQGIAGGGLLVLGQAVVADAVPARDRGRFMAPIASVFAVASVVSPLLGGALTDTVGWRWIFWINAPIGGVALLLAVVAVPRAVPERAGERLDVPGAALLAVWTTAVALVAAWAGSTFPWSSPEVLATAGLAVGSFAAFVRRCRRSPHPIVPLGMFRDRTVALGSALSFVMSFAVFGTVGYLPGLMQAAFGLPATVAGMVILPLVLGLMSASMWSGRRTSRTGRYRRMPVAGCACAAAGFVGLALIRASTPPLLVAVCAGLVGTGVGLFNQISVAVQDAVPARIVGTATSTVALVRELGVTVGAAALGGLLSARLLAGLGAQQQLARLSPDRLRALPAATRHLYATAYLSAFATVALALAALFAAALLAALALPDRRLGGAARVLPEDDVALGSVSS